MTYYQNHVGEDRALEAIDNTSQAEPDNDAEIMNDMISDPVEASSYLSDFMLDASGPLFMKMLAEANKTIPDLSEIGRLFIEAFKECERDYITMQGK